jgi:endonuclease III
MLNFFMLSHQDKTKQMVAIGVAGNGVELNLAQARAAWFAYNDRVLLWAKEHQPKKSVWVDLRSAGLSHRKVTYIKELARRVLAKEIDFAKLRQSPSEHAVQCLLEVPGVGPWTTHMFLIFGLNHPNVLALDDAGLRRATKLLYRNAKLETVSERWHPYCSVASWYLWRHLDSQ